MIRNYLKIALRSMKKYKAYTFINIVGLAIGMACCILILLWIQDELSYDTFHEHYRELCRTTPRFSDRTSYINPYALAPTLQGQFPEVQKITRFAWRTYLLKSGGQMFHETGGLVDKAFFEMFSFPLLKGNPGSVFESQESIVITERVADKYFGARDPIGQSFLVDNDAQLIVTGVLKDVPTNSHLQFDFLIPVTQMRERADADWSYDCAIYLLLQKNIDMHDFQDKISGFLMEHDQRLHEEVLLEVQPLSRIHLYALNGTDPILYVIIFMAIAVVILLIACINYINLSTAISNIRAKEIGIRKVVGAFRSDLIRQFMGESIFLSILAYILAIAFVFAFLPIFNTLAVKRLTLNVLNNISSLFGFIGIALFTGLMAGGYPALMLSSFKPVMTLKGRLQSGSGGLRLRRILVIGQFTATIILIIASVIMMRQLRFMKSRDLGLDKNHVVVIPLNSELRQSYPMFKSEIKQNPQIVHVTSAWNMPTDINHINMVSWEGRSREQTVLMRDQSIDYDYFKTFHMKIIEGRSFSEAYPTDLENYILNEEAVKRTGLESPLGKMFSAYGHEGQIIGIVKNFHNLSLHQEIKPIVFMLSKRHGPHLRVFVKIRSDDIPNTLEYLRDTAKRFAPNYPYQYSFLDEAFHQQYKNDERVGTIYGYFTAMAIIISCLGLYGMASFIAERRTKEIGIRKIVGASTAKIVMLISRQFIVLLAMSNMIAWPIAYFMMRKMLSQYAYRSELSVWIFFAAAGSTFIIALLSVCVKVIRVAVANPVDSLRHE
jgi:predicted permease